MRTVTRIGVVPGSGRTARTRAPGPPRAHRPGHRARPAGRHRPARRPRGGHLGDPEPAPRDARRGRAPAAVRAAGPPDPHELRGAARGDARPGPRGRRPLARRRHHGVLPPRRAHPRRERPVRQGVERHGAPRDDRGPRWHRPTAMGRGAAHRRARPATAPARLADRPAVQRADGHRARHAEPRQQPAGHRPPRPARSDAHLDPGARRAQPHPHPGRGAVDGGARRAAVGGDRTLRHDRRLVVRRPRRAHDGPLPRRRGDRLDARARRRRRLPPGVGVPRHSTSSTARRSRPTSGSTPP